MDELEERFLDVMDVARRLNVSKMMVYRLIHTNRIAAIKVGGTYRIPESGYKEFLQNSKV